MTAVINMTAVNPVAARRRPLRRLVPLLCLPFLAGCVSAAPQALAPDPLGPLPAVVPLPPLPGPVATAGLRHTAWNTPQPSAADSPTASPTAEPPRQPPRRPGPEHGGVPSRRPMPASTPGTGSGLPDNVCDGLAHSGLISVGSTAHRWCLAQQSGS
ncbi:hypothetical protein ACPA54_27815 [Uniformispora flossi]|uniref:hypothetical protein n=1 Tax=Uniformispora flossi TaxID=3390723 RepID=UPI003C2FC335